MGTAELTMVVCIMLGIILLHLGYYIGYWKGCQDVIDHCHDEIREINHQLEFLRDKYERAKSITAYHDAPGARDRGGADS